MNMPQPADAHRQLEVLVGDWVGDEKIHPSPFDPQGGPATGRVHNRRAVEGFAVVQDYEQQRGGKTTFRGHGVFWFDARRNAYVMTWWDSFGCPGTEFTGALNSGILLLTSSGPQGHSKATFDLREARAGNYAFRMEISPDGQQWLTFMEGSYRRNN